MGIELAQLELSQLRVGGVSQEVHRILALPVRLDIIHLADLYINFHTK